jgi:hypothetical protein
MNKYIKLKKYLKKEGHLQKYLDNMKVRASMQKGELAKMSKMDKVLSYSFEWDESPEGDRFWRDVFDTLKYKNL